jgi:hypothetical protein
MTLGANPDVFKAGSFPTGITVPVAGTGWWWIR